MSAIHGISNIWEMEAGRFFRFAARLPAYQGVMRTVAEEQARREHRRTGGLDVKPLIDPAQLNSDGLAGLIDFG